MDILLFRRWFVVASYGAWNRFLIRWGAYLGECRTHQLSTWRICQVSFGIIFRWLSIGESRTYFGGHMEGWSTQSSRAAPLAATAHCVGIFGRRHGWTKRSRIKFVVLHLVHCHGLGCYGKDEFSRHRSWTFRGRSNGCLFHV